MPPGRFWNTLEFEGQRISQGRPPSASSWSWMRCGQDRPGPVLLGLSCVLVTHRSFPNCHLPLSTRSIVFWAINPTAKRTTGPKKPHRWPGRLPLPSQSLFPAARLRCFEAKSVVCVKKKTRHPDVVRKTSRRSPHTPSSASRDPHHPEETALVIRTFSPAASTCPLRRNHRD